MRARLRALSGALFLCLAVAAPSSAMDRVHGAFYGQVLDQQWLDLEPRDVRLGFGQALFDLVGNTTGFFSHVAVTAAGGLYVSVGPSVSGGLGALYQYGVDDANAIGGSPFSGTGATPLAADSTTIFRQGLVGSPAITVGPLTAPTTSGYSVNYLVECQVQTIDTTQQSEQFEQLPNYNYATATVPRDRDDVIFCQSKASTAAVNPTAPTVDAGYIALANVVVSSGATSISANNITMTSGSVFTGFLPSYGGISVTSNGCFTTGNSSVCPSSVTAPLLLPGTTAVNTPTYNTRSIGTRAVWYAGETSSAVDFATGIANSTLWNSVPISADQFQWFAGTSPVMTLSGGGALNIAGALSSVSISTNAINANGSPISGGTFQSSTGIIASPAGSPMYVCANNNCSGMPYADTSGNWIVSHQVTANTLGVAGAASAATFATSGSINAGTTLGTSSGEVLAASGQALILCANATCGTMPYVGTDGSLNVAYNAQVSGSVTTNAITDNNHLLVGTVQITGAGSGGNPDGNALDVTGNVKATGTVSQGSSRSLKRDIRPFLQDPLTLAAAMSPVLFHYDRDPANAPMHLGIIAENTPEQIAPDHKALDIGATAVNANAAAAEAERHVRALSRRVDAIHATGGASQAQLADLQSQIATLRGFVFFLTGFTFISVAILGTLAAHGLYRRAKA